MPITAESYIVHEPGGPITLEKIQYDHVGPDEILVENAAFSVCASDLKAAKGVFYMKPPMVLGHEAAGTVIQVGSAVTTLEPGDKVILSYDSCRTCRFCVRGQNAYCTSITTFNFSGTRADGSYAASTIPSSGVAESSGNPLSSFFFGQSSMGSHSLAHITSAVKIPPSAFASPSPTTDNNEALTLFAALGCGIQTGFGAIFNVATPPPLSRIAILGAGAVGLSAALAATLTHPLQLLLIDNSSTKLALIPSDIGVTGTIDSSDFTAEGALAAELMRLSDGEGFDVVLDCVGLAALVEEGHQALASRGMMVQVGGGKESARISLTKQLLAGASYRGTHQGDSVPSVVSGLLCFLTE